MELQHRPTRLLLLAAVFLCLGLSQTLMAQLPFTRSLFVGPYTPIDTLTGATKTTITGDDGIQGTIPIGFTFNYLGTNYTTADLCANGWLSFASGGANAWTNTELFTTTIPNSTVAPWWDDLEVVAGTGVVLYQTQGTVGSRTFTVQWTNVASYRVSTTNRNLNFQAVLHEGSNIIEFKYGTFGGTWNTTESASIGLENATGGPGNFLDAVSGSGFINQSYMNTNKWPVAHIRFTPGAPTPLPGGTYTVGLAGTFPNLSEAVANLNHRGIAGPVTLSLLDANYDSTAAGGYNIFPILFGPISGNSSTNTITVQPASGSSTLTYRGSVSGSAGVQSSQTVFGNTFEPILGVIGTDYLTVRNLNLQTTGNGLVDRGLMVVNNTATNGATNNLFENVNVSLLRTNVSSIGIQQINSVTVTATAGANSFNTYRNINISNTNNGISFGGNATYRDSLTVLGTTSPTAFNSIGANVANDIGNNGSTAAYGIQLLNQASARIFNNEVRNVTSNAAAGDGILITTSYGNTEVYRNKVHDIRNSGTASTTAVNGIRFGIATTGTHNIRVYNNFVYNITHAYTGSATATRYVRGIYAQSAGGGSATTTVNVDNNSVAINATGLTASNTCYEIGTASGALINTRNNIFANFTTGHTTNGTAYHAAWTSTSATAVGSAGSVSDRNAFYVADTANGFVGRGNTTNLRTLANWQAAMSQDANSIVANPLFVSSTDLHISAAALNGAASSLAWVTTDIDNDARPGTPDIGADEFTPLTIDMSASALVAPVAAGCYTNAQQVIVRITNAGTGSIDFTATPCTVNVAITGAVTTNLQFIINNNSLNGGVPLPSTQNLNVTVGTFNMSAAGTYTFNANTVTTGDGNTSNNAITPVTINYSAGSALSARSTICDGESANVSVSGNTSSSIQWQASTDGGNTWNNIGGATSTTYSATPTVTTLYRVQMCGSLNSVHDTIVVTPIVAPTVTNDTVCGLDTLVLTATGSGTLTWYDQSSGGNIINRGTTLDTVLASSNTFYVTNTAGGTVQSVGMVAPTTGAQQSSTNYIIFDVFQSCTIQGAYVYPGAAGNVVCDLLDQNGVLITSRTVPVTAGDVGNRTYISLGIPLTPGTNYRLAQGTGSVSMYRNEFGVSYPYTLPGTISLTNSAAGTDYYYFFYDIQVLTGCESGRIPVQAVVNTPVAISASVATSPICEDDTTSLTVTSANSGYTYDWTPAAGLSSTTGANVDAMPTNTTTYIVTGVDAANCIVRDTVTINVNNHPRVSTSLSASLICISDTSTISVLSPSMYYEDTVNVFVPDNSTQTSVINVPSLGVGASVSTVCLDMLQTWSGDMTFNLVSPQGTVLELSSGNGGSGDNYTSTCFDMSALQSITTGTAPFTGSWLPEGAGGFSVFSGQNFSGNWTLQLIDGAAGDAGTLLNWSILFETPAATYNWTSSPAGFTANTPVVNVTPTVTTTYFLTVADSVTGCDTTWSFLVNVNPAITASISGPSVSCNGATHTLTASASGGDGNLSYDWDGQGTGNTLTVTVTTDTSFVVNVMDGCSTPMGTDTIFITVAQPLAVGLSNTTVCAGSPVTLNANATGGDGNYTYNWSNSATTATITVSPTTTTTYTVTVSDGCGLAPASGSSTVTVNPTTTASYSMTNTGLAYTFTNTSTNATSSSWTFGDGNTSTATSPTHTYATDGTYTVCLTTTNSCGSDTICMTINAVSASSPFGNGSVQLWPNPNTGKFNVRVDGLNGSTLRMELFNMNGQAVVRENFGAVYNSLEHTFTPDVPAGVYFLRVNDGLNTATLRVVIE